jgi:hypothetical protein
MFDSAAGKQSARGKRQSILPPIIPTAVIDGNEKISLSDDLISHD